MFINRKLFRADAVTFLMEGYIKKWYTEFHSITVYAQERLGIKRMTPKDFFEAAFA